MAAVPHHALAAPGPSRRTLRLITPSAGAAVPPGLTAAEAAAFQMGAGQLPEKYAELRHAMRGGHEVAVFHLATSTYTVWLSQIGKDRYDHDGDRYQRHAVPLVLAIAGSWMGHLDTAADKARAAAELDRTFDQVQMQLGGEAQRLAPPARALLDETVGQARRWIPTLQTWLWQPTVSGRHAVALGLLGKLREAEEFAWHSPMADRDRLYALCGLAGRQRDMLAWRDAKTAARRVVEGNPRWLAAYNVAAATELDRYVVPQQVTGQLGDTTHARHAEQLAMAAWEIGPNSYTAKVLVRLGIVTGQPHLTRLGQAYLHRSY